MLLNYSLDISFSEKIYINNKLSYLNLLSLRGVLTIVIIFHHLVVSYPSLNINLGILYYLLSHMGYLSVGIFLFMSGYGLEYNYEIKGKPYLYSLINKNKYILCIFLYINMLYFVLSPLYSSYKENIDVLYTGFFTGSLLCGPSWYLINLVCLYTLFYISKKSNHFYLILITGGLCINVFYLLIGYPIIWGISNLSFLIGVIVAKLMDNRNIYISLFKVLFYSCLLFLSFTVISCLPMITFEKFKYLSLLVSTPIFTLFAALLYLCFTYRRSWFNFLGKHSLEIFLIHVLVYKILRGNYIYINNDFLYVSSTIIISVLIALPLSYINKYLANCIK